MDFDSLLGMLLGRINTVSSKVKNVLSGITSITNVDNKLHYEFTDGTSADFNVEGNVNLTFEVDFTTGHMNVTGGGN